MEKYLSKCLDSLLLPEFQENLEVLLINDGSKDQTLSIANKYEGKYPQILRVIDKPNGGWGTAINRGIQEASGKYFKILDADDWFDANELIKFITLLQSVDVDLVASSFSYEPEGGESRDSVYDMLLCDKTTLFVDYLKANEFNKYLPMATLTFQTQLLKDNQINIIDRYYGDIDYNLVPLVYVKTLWFTRINLYKYYIGRKGQSTSLEGYRKHLKDYIDLCKKLTLFYSENSESMEDAIQKMFFKDNLNVIRFSYLLLLSLNYGGKEHANRKLLADLDRFLKKTSKEFYNATNKICLKKYIPYIYIWRKIGLNVLNFRIKL